MPVRLPQNSCSLSSMFVIKRDGTRQKVSFDKITQRVEGVCQKLNLHRIDPTEVAKETVSGLYNGITTEELDMFASIKCAERVLDDPQFNNLAAGLAISNLHKTTSENFMDVTEALYNNLDRFGSPNPRVTDQYYNFVKDNQAQIQEEIDYNRDYLIDFFGMKTLERSYLIRVKTEHDNSVLSSETAKGEAQIRNKKGKIVERPQHMFMRVALAIHLNDIESAFETYHMMSQKYFTHASPTLYNAGSPKNQMSSCYLLGMDDDLDCIADTFHDCMRISKWAGGIGIHLSDIRARGSLIRGTNGDSEGIVPLIKTLNEIARYVNQGGRRNGAIAVYIPPWHADIYDFCDLRKNTGAEELRARDIFLALWVPDLFFKRFLEDGYWSLFCPDECPELTRTWGEEFEQLYTMYEKEGRYRKRVKAKDLMYHIVGAQIETGMPYMCCKDTANRFSNQQNIGTIQSSNLCAEIYEYSDQKETAVCNLASICLPRFIEEKDGVKFYNYQKLVQIAQIVTRNLNKVIDINYYPTEKTKKSNFKHRPIGIGVQGLADVYCILGHSFDSPESQAINKRIHESIYYGACIASNELAKQHGPYETFEGSPFSEGKLQFHLQGLNENELLMGYDWKSLIESIKEHGMRNSLLTAFMPTASTSQIMGNNECIEPYTSNMYTRSTQAGEFIVVNQHLMEELISRGLWTKDVRDEFMFDNGSIQNIKVIPQHLKDTYKTAFEMKIKPIVDQAVGRGIFCDQGQSMNLFCKDPSFQRLISSHIYGWKKGLKTLLYYLRSQPAVDAVKFGLDPMVARKIAQSRGLKGSDYSKPEVSQRDANYLQCDMCSA